VLATFGYQIHGDNIVECERTFNYVVLAISPIARDIVGPKGSVTCPAYEIELQSGDKLNFTFLPGFGERRWNQDILKFVQSSGGRLREATDAIVTVLKDGTEKPLFSMEFCGALPAGNNAWQRHGRAFSFAHAGIPYFYLAELGGYELTSDRERKAERWPNPAVPFSFFSMTHYHGSVCLPVYEANSGARSETTSHYSSIFGKEDFLDYVRLAITDELPDKPAQKLGEKCIALVELLAASKKRPDGLTKSQWGEARKAVEAGEALTRYLASKAPIAWRKTAYIAALTKSAREFMTFGAQNSLGLTSKTLPLSFVPREHRPTFAAGVQRIYADLGAEAATWIAKTTADLAIAWVMGFKPRGDDARPDRGLPPLARMLIGDKTDLLAFVYGPAPVSHWKKLGGSPGQLAGENGLWEAVLGVSDALLCDSATMPAGSQRCILKPSWEASFPQRKETLHVNPVVLSHSEHDVDTALHVILASLGSEIVFEGMCNPPGGDWSGVSFVWSKDVGEHRWLTLPRVTAEGAKRPDHVFGLFGLGDSSLCLCVESKERPRSLEPGIGHRLISYTKALFAGSPSIWRRNAAEAWDIYTGDWKLLPSEFVSMGAYIADAAAPFGSVPPNTDLDILCGFVFYKDNPRCVAHVRALTQHGGRVLDHIIEAIGDSPFVEFRKAKN
jgi:hypothetical protein